MMETMTSFDCHAEARLKATIITCQRKLSRFLQRISEKEKYAALYKSKFMCERYDEEIEDLYAKVAELEGSVLASELGLEQIADKRREDEAQRMARILQISAPTLVPTAATSLTPPPSQSATLRTEQLTLFGPGPVRMDTRPSGSRSADHDWAVENDVAVGFEHFTEAADEVQSELRPKLTRFVPRQSRKYRSRSPTHLALRKQIPRVPILNCPAPRVLIPRVPLWLQGTELKRWRQTLLLHPFETPQRYRNRKKIAWRRLCWRYFSMN